MSLVESEFFGHEKGAFTGATARRLFLDEVGELPLEIEVKLLSVLQQGEFEPVVSSRTKTVDVRVIAATHRDLSREVQEGRRFCGRGPSRGRPCESFESTLEGDIDLSGLLGGWRR